MTRIHLDTDLGSDPDDLCALAMLLGWPDVHLTGVTTNTDPGGRRAGYVAYALQLAGRPEVPVVAGAEATLGPPMVPFEFPDYWPEPIAPRPSSPGRALELLAENAEAGATVVAIGPYTNLALLEAARPGLLRSSGVLVMGGHVPPPRPGLPPLGADDDFNIQQDAPAAHVVLERCDPLVVPLAVTMTVSVRAAHVPRLRQAGPLGGLLADQADAYARDKDRLGLARRFEGLPDDLLNFQHDPLACAVAAGWDGAVIEHTPTALEVRDRRLWMIPRADAPALRVVTAVDAPRFEEAWLEAVERASSRLAPS